MPGFINNLEVVWDNPLMARFLKRLASFSRLIMIDRRGMGLSDRLSPEDLPPSKSSWTTSTPSWTRSARSER